MKNIFKTKDNKLMSYNKEYFHEDEGYKTSLHVNKIDFGDPIGWIKIEGNNVKIKIDGNLNKGRRLVIEIGYKLKEKYKYEPDYGVLHELFEPIFQRFFDDFYGKRQEINGLPRGFGSGGRVY